MTNRGDARDSILRERLASVSDWPDATLNQWINDAIAEYSVHFPRYLTGTINCVADQVEYSLSSLTNPQRILCVEYPDGGDPMTFLARRAVNDTRGFWGKDYYDVWGADSPSTLVIGQKPSLGEDIVVHYLGDHDYPSTDNDVLTVPDRHLEGLALFVWMCAARELLAAEAADPQTTTLLLAQFDVLVYRAGREFREWLRRVQGEAEEEELDVEGLESASWEHLRSR